MLAIIPRSLSSLLFGGAPQPVPRGPERPDTEPNEMVQALTRSFEREPEAWTWVNSPDAYSGGWGWDHVDGVEIRFNIYCPANRGGGSPDFGDQRYEASVNDVRLSPDQAWHLHTAARDVLDAAQERLVKEERRRALDALVAENRA